MDDVISSHCAENIVTDVEVTEKDIITAINELEEN